MILGDLVAYVPNSAASRYGATDLLKLSSIVINSGGVAGGVTSNGIHLNAYLDDVNSDGTINSTDYTLTNNVATGAPPVLPTSPLSIRRSSPTL